MRAAFIPLLSLFSVALVTGVFACSPSAEPGTVEFWLEQLDDTQKRQEALRELGKLGDERALPAVLTLFNEPGEWQPKAAFALGQLGDVSATQDLIANVDFQVGTGRDKGSKLKQRINQNVARALGMLKATDGVDPMINLMKNQEPNTKEQAMIALGKIGDERGVEPLMAIATGTAHPYLRKIAIQSLGDLGNAKAIPALIEMLFVEVPGISFVNEAGYSLAQIGKPAADALVTTLERKNKKVEAIRLGDGSKIQEGAIEAKAARILGDLKISSAEKSILAALGKYYGQFTGKGQMHATIPGAVMELTEALGKVGGDASVPMIQKIALTEDARVRGKATEALTNLGARKAIPTLVDSAKKGTKEARRHAVVAISRLGLAKDIASYDTLAAGGGEVDGATMKKLIDAHRGRLVAAKECDTKADCWTAKLSDADALVRERAALELGWGGDAASISGLLKAAEDDDADVRLAAIHSLAKMDGLKTDQLQPIWDKWHEKIDYRVPNDELKRLIARVNTK